MTALETLQKYGLKTDVKSIKERIGIDTYLADLYSVIKIPGNEYLCDVGWDKLNAVRSVCRNADLALLCELAEKGERENRYENAVKKHRERAMEDNRVSIDFELEDIIRECEGEPR